MIALSQARVKRLTAIHGWSAVVLGLLLYAVVLTGAVAVFAPEVGRWSAGGLRDRPPMEGPVDALVRQLAREVDPAHREDVGLWSGEGNDLVVVFHTHKLNPESGIVEDFGTLFRADPTTGAVLSRHDGFIWNEPSAWETSALRRFLVDLHVRLYLPDPWGLIVTGILGLMMMTAVVSGILMHRHLIRDLFVTERPGGRLVSVRDRHILASTWSIPFAFLLAFTGSFFSFASTIAFPIVAAIAFGGDQEAMVDTLFEPPVVEDATPVPLASLDYIIADSNARVGVPTEYVGVSHWGRADARVYVWHDPRPGGLGYVQNVFDGPSRQFLGRQAAVGAEPSAGATLYGLMAPLHFGHFAGLLSQAVWGGLGVAMCVVILSGMRLWIRRRADSPAWRRFGLATQATGYGLPLGMVTSAYAYFLAVPAGDAFFWTPLGFLPGVAVAAWLAVRIPDEDRLGRAFQRLLGIACLLLPVLRLATGGMTWADALIGGQHDVLTVDLLLLLAGAWLLHFSRRPRAVAVPRAVLEPAE